jgi:hypothetical protein
MLICGTKVDTGSVSAPTGGRKINQRDATADAPSCLGNKATRHLGCFLPVNFFRDRQKSHPPPLRRRARGMASTAMPTARGIQAPTQERESLRSGRIWDKTPMRIPAEAPAGVTIERDCRAACDAGRSRVIRTWVLPRRMAACGPATRLFSHTKLESITGSRHLGSADPRRKLGVSLCSRHGVHGRATPSGCSCCAFTVRLGEARLPPVPGSSGASRRGSRPLALPRRNCCQCVSLTPSAPPGSPCSRQ